MKLAIISNYLNHHQIPICKEFIKVLGSDNFKFISTEPMEKERINMGWQNPEYIPFEIQAWRNEELRSIGKEIAQTYDVVIAGGSRTQEKLIISRLKQRKLTFRYSERILKKGLRFAYSPSRIKYVYETYFRYRHAPMYMLCSGAYVASDYAMYFAYKNKCFKWGYFPEFIPDKDKNMNRKNNEGPINIVWASRFIDWKHPERMLSVARLIKDNKYDARITMIGSGELFDYIRREILFEGLDDIISLTGSLPPEFVREHMMSSHIFIQTSDYKEGWGAVINEAMNSGCVVIASHAEGAVPYLIKDGVNGLIYQEENANIQLLQKVRLLLDNPSQISKLGANAYDTISNVWNAKNAVASFMKLIESNMKASCIEGPCSKEQAIFQWEMYDRIRMKAKD